MQAITLEYETQSRRPYRGDAAIPLTLEETSCNQTRTARPLLTADEVRRLGRDEAIIVVSNQRPIWTKRWWWNCEAREAPACELGPAKVVALTSPAKPASPTSPTSPPKPRLGDPKAKLEQMDDDDLDVEDLPDDVGRDHRR